MTSFFDAKDSFQKNMSRNKNTPHSVANYRNTRFEAEILIKTTVWGRFFFMPACAGYQGEPQFAATFYPFQLGWHQENLHRSFVHLYFMQVIFAGCSPQLASGNANVEHDLIMLDISKLRKLDRFISHFILNRWDRYFAVRNVTPTYRVIWYPATVVSSQ